MSRPQNILRPIKLTTTLPEDVHGPLTLHLFSEVEGRVPQGAYQSFLVDRIREFFSFKRFDTGHGVIQGPAPVIKALQQLITRHDVTFEELIHAESHNPRTAK